MRQDGGQDDCRNHTKAIFRTKMAFKCCIKQCILLESPFLLYIVICLSVWFSIMTTHHNNEKDGDQNGHHNYDLKDCVL